MHHHLYPTQDAYISNKSTEKDKNFGIDEMLSIGVSHSYDKVLNETKTYHYDHESVSGMPVDNFTGILTGSFFGVITNSNGTIVGNVNKFTASYFSGSINGSIDGLETGSAITSTSFDGTLNGFSGNISSYTINGNVSSSIIANCFATFTGQLTSSTGNISGYVLGNEIKNEQNITTTDTQYINRSLIKFDLSFISQSIVSSNITNPKFFLKLKSTQAKELPIDFKIYAFPINQNWENGDGYWCDGGSDTGVSWNWKDYNSGSIWFSPHTDAALTSSVDYINDYGVVSESFMRGGGTWYNLPCSQSFNYEVSDINMDVTSIVNGWLSKTISNNGFILMYGGETSFTSSNSQMYFFSKDTNTIYTPTLDVAWDNATWVTGSFGTGSVNINTYVTGFSGSMSSGVDIWNVTASGNFSGNAYLTFNVDDSINSGLINTTGTSGNINGVSIIGDITGSSVNVDGIRYITASIVNGEFTSSVIQAQYSSSNITGFLSGSFMEQLFLGHTITGSVTYLNPNNYITFARQNSPVAGDLFGSITHISDYTGIFNGVVTSGLLTGANLTIPFTGSCITSSFAITSSVEITGSGLNPLNTEKPFVVIIQDLKKEYSFGDMVRIGVFGREHYPLKTFEKAPQQPIYVTPRYLPTSSYYAIKDNETEEVIIDFDSYTKISCGVNGNYFYLDTTGLAQERYYKVLIRVVDSNGETYTFDSLDIFKIRR